MHLLEEVKISCATEGDIPRIISFLSRPEIDQAFVRPLSNRGISIKERVENKFPNGFWLIASHDEEIVGCRGCKGVIDHERRIVEFSTTAIAPDFRGIGLGPALLRTAVKIAFERYLPLIMRYNSWSTNIAMRKASLKAGFTVSRIFEDPWKRPPGVKSVEYSLDCSNLYLDER